MTGVHAFPATRTFRGVNDYRHVSHKSLLTITRDLICSIVIKFLSNLYVFTSIEFSTDGLFVGDLHPFRHFKALSVVSSSSRRTRDIFRGCHRRGNP